MRKGIYMLPNLLTVTGMFFGFFSIISSLNGFYERAAWAIIAAAVFDGLDGWVARMTKTTSRFGVELDSLSDLVSFGLAPALLFYIWALTPFGRLAVGCSGALHGAAVAGGSDEEAVGVAEHVLAPGVVDEAHGGCEE